MSATIDPSAFRGLSQNEHAYSLFMRVVFAAADRADENLRATFEPGELCSLIALQSRPITYDTLAKAITHGKREGWIVDGDATAIRLSASRFTVVEATA